MQRQAASTYLARKTPPLLTEPSPPQRIRAVPLQDKLPALGLRYIPDMLPPKHSYALPRGRRGLETMH
jgi:hypothetical protein